MTGETLAITVNVSTRVVWRNSSQVIHNVMDDSSKALSRVDVSLPSGHIRSTPGCCNQDSPSIVSLASQASTTTSVP